MSQPPRVAVVGLGYVGLPLAIALARHYDVVGFDIDRGRIAALTDANDETGEVEPEALAATRSRFTAEAADIEGLDIFIVTVPTPVDAGNRPDLSALRSACATVGAALKPGAMVVFESTVYPGVTEDICAPALEAASGLTAGRDFFLGYSPERINPGDREHSVDRITKVVAGQTPEVAERLAVLYGAVTSAGVFVAKDIRTAEAAKVIENAQRDINIAFVNEIAMIFGRMGLSVGDVLEAARTKWNFLGFTPGLVGGHCIGVDPYYLAHAAQEVDYHPEIILAGRRINDGMGGYVARRIHEALTGEANGSRPGRCGADNAARILVLGVTFKENVPDLRNSKVVDIISGLRARGHRVDVHDPLADPAVALAEYGLELLPDLESASGYRAIVGAVAHDAYRGFEPARFSSLLEDGGLVADVKGVWRDHDLPPGLQRWTL